MRKKNNRNLGNKDCYIISDLNVKICCSDRFLGKKRSNKSNIATLISIFQQL